MAMIPRFSTARIKQRIETLSDMQSFVRHATPFIGPYAIEKLYNEYAIYVIEFDPDDKGYHWRHYDLNDACMAVDLLLFKHADTSACSTNPNISIGYILANGKGICEKTLSCKMRHHVTTVTYNNKHINMLEPFARTLQYTPKRTILNKYQCSYERTKLVKTHTLMIYLLKAYYATNERHKESYLNQALGELIHSNRVWPTPLRLLQLCLFTEEGVVRQPYKCVYNVDDGKQLRAEVVWLDTLTCNPDDILTWQPHLLLPAAQSGIRIERKMLRHAIPKRIFFIPVTSITDDTGVMSHMLMDYLKALIRRDNVLTHIGRICKNPVPIENNTIADHEHDYIHQIFLTVQHAEQRGDNVSYVDVPSITKLTPPPCITGLFDKHHKMWDYAVRFQLAYILSSVAHLCDISVETIAKPFVEGLEKRNKRKDSLEHFLYCLKHNKRTGNVYSSLMDTRKCKHRQHPTVNAEGIACPFGGNVTACLASRHNTNATLTKDNATVSLIWTQTQHKA
jgi:hypothetical protein